MHLECRVLGKLRPTVGAFVGFRARVCPLVQQQGSFGAKGLSTFGANMSQISLMYLSLVADDILLPLKGLCAGVTCKEPLITVDMLLMDL